MKRLFMCVLVGSICVLESMSAHAQFHPDFYIRTVGKHVDDTFFDERGMPKWASRELEQHKDFQKGYESIKKGSSLAVVHVHPCQTDSILFVKSGINAKKKIFGISIVCSDVKKKGPPSFLLHKSFLFSERILKGLSLSEQYSVFLLLRSSIFLKIHRDGQEDLNRRVCKYLYRSFAMMAKGWLKPVKAPKPYISSLFVTHAETIRKAFLFIGEGLYGIPPQSWQKRFKKILLNAAKSQKNYLQRFHAHNKAHAKIVPPGPQGSNDAPPGSCLTKACTHGTPVTYGADMSPYLGEKFGFKTCDFYEKGSSQIGVEAIVYGLLIIIILLLVNEVFSEPKNTNRKKECDNKPKSKEDLETAVNYLSANKEFLNTEEKNILDGATKALELGASPKVYEKLRENLLPIEGEVAKRKGSKQREEAQKRDVEKKKEDTTRSVTLKEQRDKEKKDENQRKLGSKLLEVEAALQACTNEELKKAQLIEFQKVQEEMKTESRPRPTKHLKALDRILKKLPRA